MAYGVTDEGFVLKTLLVILDEIDTNLKSYLGNNINTQPQSVLGQLKANAADKIAELWELFEAIYNSAYPNTAFGKSLEDVGSVTNCKKLGELPSRITGLALFGTPTTEIPMDTIVSVSSDASIQFTTDETVTLGAGQDAIQVITFSNTPNGGSFKISLYGETTSAIAYDASNNDTEDAINALTRFSDVDVSGSFATDLIIKFEDDDGKQEIELMTIVDNTLNLDTVDTVVTPSINNAGEYQAQVDCTCTETGATAAPYMTVDTIDTPVSGLTRVFNPEDAALGREAETDAEYRIRRLELLQTSLGGTLEGLITSILLLNETEGEDIAIENLRIFENYTNATVGDLPPHSFKVVVYQTGGSTDRDDDIAEAIFAAKPLGIEPIGDISKDVTDSQGFDHTIKFSRPDEIDIYLIVDLTIDSDVYPDDGDTQLKALLVAWGNDIGVGNDVIVYPQLVSILTGVEGITDVAIKIEGVPDGDPPTPATLDDNIDIDDGTGGYVELSRWDTSRITINHV